MQIRPASPDDFGAIFTLQRAAFVDEARLYGTPDVPSLNETLDELTARMAQSTSFVAVDGHRIVGAVSLRTYRNDVPDVERLMVAPDRRGQGISTQLLAHVEDHAREQGQRCLQLVVGAVAETNRAIYRHLGWVDHSIESLEGFDDVILHTLVKQL